jgi:pilus assembly protein CpaF
MSILKRLQGGNTGSGPAAPGTNDPNGGPNIQARRVSAPSIPSAQDTYQDLKGRVQNKLISTLDPSTDATKIVEVRKTIQDLFEQILAEENIVLSRPERARMLEQIAAEILGFGPLQILLEDESITEIMVNGAKNIYVERAGRLHRAPITFESNEHVMRIIERIVSPLGRRIDESSPYVDARLPDGSRVNAVIPPISLVGPILTIRKFSKKPISVDQLIGFGSISPEAVEFLKACVSARMNIIVSGGTGSGKTTLLKHSFGLHSF